jgi:transposase
MRAFDPEVVDAVWAAIEPLLPVRNETHPLGCHRPRIPDRACFEVMLVRLVTGRSWEDAERLCDKVVSDTTARARRDEWVEAGVFEQVAEEALSGYDKIVGLDLSEVAIDASVHKAPGQGEGTGANPTDRGRSGWKWSLATDFAGVPLGWAIGAANRHDQILLAPTLAAVAARGLELDVETVHLDRGYDASTVRETLRGFGINDACIARRRTTAAPKKKTFAPRGLRWPVERTNSSLANFGQLRRNTDRKIAHRLAQFALVVVLLITAKLIDWRNRWSPGCVPIR